MDFKFTWRDGNGCSVYLMDVMHVVWSSNCFYLVVHRENDNICSTLGFELGMNGFTDNWELILALASYLES